MDAKTLARFWAKVDVAGPDECWLWTASRHLTNKPFESQYGQFWLDGTLARAHRVSYMIAHGDYPADGLLVLHGCHNPPCVNPTHLHPGTNAENLAEMLVAGRDHYCVGETHGRAKLTDAKVLYIRTLYADGTSLTALAQMHLVHLTTIRMIVNRQTWRHI